MHDKSIPKLRFPGFTDEWEQCKVGEISSIIAGGTPSTKVLSYWEPKEIPWLSSGEVHKKYVYDADEMISENGLKNSSAKWVEKGSVLIALAGQGKTRGTAAITRVSITTNQSIAAIKFDDILDPDYAFQNLDSRYNELRNISSGDGTRGGLNKQLLSDLEIMFPTLEEQKKIGDYFRIFDDIINLHQRKYDSLKELRDGIIQRIFSRELRFKRLDGREFENWVTKELSEIFTERKVSQTITEDAPLLSFTIEQGVISPQDKKTNKRDFLIKDKDTKKFALTEVDDIIYNPANLKYGAIHRNKLMRGVVSPIYAIFYTEQNPAFMEYVVKNPAFIKNSMKYLEGTVIKLMTLKPRDFLKLKVEIPASLEEQKIIADFLMKFDETIDAEQKKIEKWKELKKGLLQQMFV